MEENQKKKKGFKYIIYIAVALFIVAASFIVLKKVRFEKEFDYDAIKKISNLHTLKCSFKNVATKEFSDIRGKEKIIIEYTAIVDIGIDMKEVTVDKENKTISIPKAKVLYKNYDTNSIKIYDSKFKFWSKIDNDLTQELLSTSLDDLVLEVEGNEYIMQKAQSLAKSQLANLVKMLSNSSRNFTEFEMVTQDIIDVSDTQKIALNS
ncbi:MAG: DUF4230 domain-containing protein [Lachnospiraceae bacterium]|nr:DUF4230 domain-containing protein [Lachnospiraceae bacterium]